MPGGPLNLAPTNQHVGIWKKYVRGFKNEQPKMVQVTGESSNRLFQVLEEWNAILQGSSLYALPSQVGG
jgi:hypothetical protein